MPSIAPPASDEGQTFRITHPFHPLHGCVFRWVDCRQTWGEDRVYFYNDAGELARLPVRWTDVVPADPTAVVGAGRASFRYDDLCRLADLLTFITSPASTRRPRVPSPDHHFNNLYRSRQTITAIQKQAQADAALLGRVGEALAAVRESERVLAEIQQRLETVRRDTEKS